MILAEATRAIQEAPSQGEVEAALDEIFARPEFLTQKKAPWDRWLSDFIDALERWLEGTGIDGHRAGQIAAWLVYGFLIAVAAIVIFSLARALWRARAARERVRESGASPAHAGKLVAKTLCREAKAAYERGDHRSAVRLYFRALVMGLSEHGDLEYRDSWTNRELVQRGAPPAELVPVLQSLMPRLDAQSFGHVAAGPLDVEAWAALVRRHLPGVHA